MKKARIIMAILVVLLGISFGLNLKHSAERNNARGYLLNQVNYSFVNISRDLDKIISFVEGGLTNDNTITDTLMRISSDFMKVDSLLNQYRTSSPTEKLSYGAIPKFDDIALTLGFGNGTVNNMRYNCILYDNIISENEILYLTTLRDDIQRLSEGMQSSVNPPNENEKLSIAQLNNLLREFFAVWSYHNESSPYFLLRSEPRSMRLDDVRAIADTIGTDLTMGDLRGFTVDDLGDGLYGYRVIGGLVPYNLVVASDDMHTVRYTKFYNALIGGVLGDTSENIDIRYYDIDNFIANGSQELIRPLP